MSLITMENRGKGAFPDIEEVRFELSLEVWGQRIMTRYTVVFLKGDHNFLQILIKLLITSQSYNNLIIISSSVSTGGSNVESEVS